MSSITFSGTPVDTTPLSPGSMTFNYGSSAVDRTFPVNVDLPPVVKVDFTSMTIFEYAVAYKTLMQKLTLPAGFGQNGTSFGFCFYKCESLQKLALPAGFGQYGARFSACFQSCAKLAELALPPDGKFMA